MSNFFSGGGGSGGGYGIGVSQPSSSSAFTNPVNPGFGGFDTGGTQFADPSSAFGGGANGGANLWGDKQQQQQGIIIDQPGSGVDAGTPLFPYAPSAATTTPASTWASSNGSRGGSTNIGDDYVVPSGNLFQFAPRTSIVVLGTFFGIAVVVLTRIAKNVRMGIAFATTLTLAASIGFMIEWGDMEVSCQDVWEKNLGIGVLFGFLLVYTIWFLKRTVLRLSKAERYRQAFLNSGMPLQGTIVQKSFETVEREDGVRVTRYYWLHIQYNEEIRRMPSLTKTACSSTSICQETELASKASNKDTISTIASSFGMDSPISNVQPRTQWYWKETISAMGGEQEPETDDPLCWIPYDDDCNLQLETAFQEGMTYSPEIMGRYIVEFPTMTQTNAVTGFRRMVKRIVLSADEDDLCHHKETHKSNINPLQKNQFDDEFPDSHFGTPMHSPGDMSNVSGYKISTDVERQHQEEKTTVTTIYPFQVKKQVYDEFKIGDYIELLQLPGNPFAIQVKSELTWYYGYLCLSFVFIPQVACPAPFGLAIYLPIRFLNWDFCRESVIVCMSIMVITCVFLLYACGCLHTSMTLSQFLKKIQQCRARNNEKLEYVEVKESHDAALASLQEKVVRTMSVVPDGDDTFRLSCDEVDELLYRTLFQADVSAGRTIPDCVVDRGSSVQNLPAATTSDIQQLATAH